MHLLGLKFIDEVDQSFHAAPEPDAGNGSLELLFFLVPGTAGLFTTETALNGHCVEAGSISKLQELITINEDKGPN